MASFTKNVSLLRTSPDATVILVTGGTGAGKTTYAMALAQEIGAVRFSIDEWMTDLFWMDAPEPPSFDWAMSRIGRAETRIREMAAQILSRDVPVILDLGFTKCAHRRAFADWAERLGHTAVLHWIDLPPETRWERVQGRNREQGETFAMEVPRAMFEFMEGEWEPPTDDEMVIRKV